jgi:hypothetical protein
MSSPADPASSASRPTRAIERVQPQRDRFRDAHRGFAAACESPDASRESLVDGLDLLRAAFEVHVLYAEGERGLFEELLEDAPTEAAPEVDRLKRDHELIAGVIDRTGDLLAEGAGPQDDRLNDATAELVRLIGAHRRRGAELLYNVYAVDVGAGD